MADICVFHVSLNTFGGGERVVLEVLKSLEFIHESPLLVTLEPLNNPLLYEVAKELQRTRVLWFFKSRAPVTLKATVSLPVLKLLSRVVRHRCDVIISVSGLCSVVLGDITYVHWPFHLDLQGTFSTIFEKLYGVSLLKAADFINAFLKPKYILYNSALTFQKTSELIERLKHVIPITYSKYMRARHEILFPPVNSKDISAKVDLNSKEDVVIVLSRISREKRLELLLPIAKNVAEDRPDVKFIVVGALNDLKYFTLLKTLFEKYSIPVTFAVNVSDEEKLKLLSKAKVLLHLMPYEHFGIAIVEGMAAGAIPIVHRESGVARFIEDRWLWSKYSEIPDKIRSALDYWSPGYARKLMDTALKFDTEVFRRRFIEIYQRVCSNG